MRSESMTVGEIRKAIEGMPDDTPAILACGIEGGTSDSLVYVELKGMKQDDARLMICLHVILEDDDEADHDLTQYISGEGNPY
jgi:hypothetical protein